MTHVEELCRKWLARYSYDTSQLYGEELRHAIEADKAEGATQQQMKSNSPNETGALERHNICPICGGALHSVNIKPDEQNNGCGAHAGCVVVRNRLSQQGISRAELRQRAAFAAMQGMLADPTFESESSIVEIAVGMADALVAELERRPEESTDGK